MIYAISILAICVIYLYGRITYVRNQWTKLLKESVELVRWDSKDSETMTNILNGYYEKISTQLNEKYKSDVKRWCVEQVTKLPYKGDVIKKAEEIEGYILKKEQSDKNMFDAAIRSTAVQVYGNMAGGTPQERFDKIKDEKPDLSKIVKLIKDGQKSYKNYQEEMDRKFTAGFEYLAGVEWLSKQADDVAKEFKEKNRNK